MSSCRYYFDRIHDLNAKRDRQRGRGNDKDLLIYFALDELRSKLKEDIKDIPEKSIGEDGRVKRNWCYWFLDLVENLITEYDERLRLSLWPKYD